MIVYLITNLINGKRYVGQTNQSLLKRWNGHVYTNVAGEKSHLHSAIRKYGSENFEIVPLVVVETKQESDYYEIELIKALGLRDASNGYNLTDGGEGTVGAVLSEEHKRKIGLASAKFNKGRKHTAETREKVSKSLMGNTRTLGHKLSQETKDKIGRANAVSMLGNKSGLGRVFSQEVRDKISKAQFANMTVEQRKRRSVLSTHKQWHENRNLVKLDCVVCQEILSSQKGE